MTFELVPRDLIFAGMYPPGHVPDYSSGAPRLKLRNMLGLAVHYTGVQGFADPGDTIEEIRAIQRHARDSGRYGTGWEYGYVIPRDDDPHVYEYAGQYLAYHTSAKDPATGRQYNYSRASVLILTGPNDPPIPDRVVDKVRWLYALLVNVGVLAPDALIQGHRDLASTSCPGDQVYRRLPDMRIPWTDPNQGDFLTVGQYENIMAELGAIRAENRDRYADLKDRQVRMFNELREQGGDIDAANSTLSAVRTAQRNHTDQLSGIAGNVRTVKATTGRIEEKVDALGADLPPEGPTPVTITGTAEFDDGT